jgi:hypothetical protein
MHIPELAATLYYERLKSIDNLPTYSIGWLGDTVPRQGKVAAEILNKLKYFAAANSQENVFGSHTCEICGDHENHGEIIVTTGNAHYLLPKMVFHYIERHNYLPPDQFLTELLHTKIDPALQRTRPSRSSCNPRVSQAGSLSNIGSGKNI